MSTTAVRPEDAATGTRATQIDLKLEVITLPVSDFDRAKAFYERLGWRLDADFKDGSNRAIQFTPPGSGCSIHLVKNGSGPVQGMYLVVTDIEAAHDDLVRRGVEVGRIFHFASGSPFSAVVEGIAPEHRSYGSHATFQDPDGNGWVLQEVTTRFAGRVAGDTTYASADDLAQALRRAEAAHGEHEKRMGGQRDADWPTWYAEYMKREQSGEEPPL